MRTKIKGHSGGPFQTTKSTKRHFYTFDKIFAQQGIFIEYFENT